MSDDVEEDHSDNRMTTDWWATVCENCFRFFGFTSFEQVERLTIPEYEMLCQAYKLKAVDEQSRMHQQAWLNIQAGAQKESGKKLKPVYKTFKSFFDYEKELKKARGEEDDRFEALKQHMRKKYVEIHD